MRNWRAYVRERFQVPGVSAAQEAEAIEELALQLEDVARGAIAAGASEDEACAIAERHVPDWATLAAEVSRERRSAVARPRSPGIRSLAPPEPSERRTRWALPAGIAGDLVYAFRVLRAHRAFTLTAALTLAIGIGTTTALFSVVDAVLLRPLPFRDSDRLVRLTSLRPNGEPGGISYPDFLDWRARSHSFDRMSVYTARTFALREAEGVSQVRGAVVSANLFTLLGASASHGRVFVESEDSDREPTAIVLSDRFWRERYDADPRIIGRTIEINQKSATVVGVMPPEFRFPIGGERAELWTTIAEDQRSIAPQRGMHYLSGLARLAPEVSANQAEAELRTIVDALNKQYPENDPRGALVRPELREMVADVQSIWLALLGAAGCLLLIACANVVNMLLARAASRRRELAVRFALGASRGRVVRQLLTEHAVLGTLGGVLGLFFAQWCIVALKQAAPPGVPRLEQAGLNPNVLLFVAGISFVAVLLFGLLPAAHASTVDPARFAGLGVRGQGDGAGNRTRRALVVAQIALAMVLLIGGALLIRTLISLARVDTGFSSARVVTFRIGLPDEYPAAREQIFYEQLFERLRAMPGVRSASAALAPPFSGREINTGAEIEGRPARPGASDPTNFNAIQPGYFHTLGVPLVAGRDFTGRDTLDAQPVAIVNEAFVRTYFAGVNPIGRHVRPGIGNGYDNDPLREIVAVVGDVQASSLKTAPLPEVFVPAAQCPSFGSTMVVIRTDLDPQGLARDARRLVSTLESSTSVSRAKMLDDYVALAFVEPRFSSLLVALFAIFSSLLAGVGLYGLISYGVAQRTQEIGVRLALGAAPRGVLTLILRQGASIAIVGIALGSVSALVTTRWMVSFLYGISPHDPVTFAAVGCLLFAVALAASAFPALRAMRVDPITALRRE